MYFYPSVKTEQAINVEVVVPSPADKFVLPDDFLIKEYPMSKNLFADIIFLQTVTPSFVIFGGCTSSYRATFFPLGPNVTPTDF